jgi:hypothetical protein
MSIYKGVALKELKQALKSDFEKREEGRLIGYI